MTSNDQDMNLVKNLSKNSNHEPTGAPRISPVRSRPCLPARTSRNLSGQKSGCEPHMSNQVQPVQFKSSMQDDNMQDDNTGNHSDRLVPALTQSISTTDESEVQSHSEVSPRGRQGRSQWRKLGKGLEGNRMDHLGDRVERERILTKELSVRCRRRMVINNRRRDLQI